MSRRVKKTTVWCADWCAAKNLRYHMLMRKRAIPKCRIMYIECKGDDLNGPARIGRVTFSKTGKTIYYRGKEFLGLGGQGFKANYRDVETREEYWISGPRRDGEDRLYLSNLPVEIDEDVREEYWTEIRKKPELKHKRTT